MDFNSKYEFVKYRSMYVLKLLALVLLCGVSGHVIKYLLFNNILLSELLADFCNEF